MKKNDGRFVTDHLGNQFPSINTMCKKYNITPSAYRARIKRGWSQEEALIKKVTTRKKVPVYDHMGNIFPSLKALCQHYGINKTTLRERLKAMPLSDALILPINSKKTPSKYRCKDHTGREYVSMTSMCKVYGTPLSTFLDRIHKGWTMERSLTQPPIDTSQVITDHYGYRHKSITSMCQKYGIAPRTFSFRVKKLGWSVEKALTTPPRNNTKNKPKTPIKM